ncbi:MAG: glycosyltransferase [Butyrivibrio sp.]|nr:glycosyltransferase [Butyrivibrio sp.]
MNGIKKTATVFLSTYNGEKYLKEQIDSILTQSEVFVHIIIRDDGSKDNTVNIIKEYEKKHGNIRGIFGENIGCGYSFLKMIYEEEYEDTDLYAFSDQDDIWDDDKLISASKLMDNSKKCFYYSAQNIVDENSKFIRYENCFERVSRYNIYSASMIGLSRGCTQVWNNAFHKTIVERKPNLKNILIHDTWLHYNSFFDCKQIYDPMPHMSYRQTRDNLIGADIGMGLIKNIRRKYNKFKYHNERLARIREKSAVEYEKFFSENYDSKLLMTAHYRENLFNRIYLMFSSKYNQGVSMNWRIYNTWAIIRGKL